MFLGLVFFEISVILVFTYSLERRDFFGIERLGWVLLVLIKRILLMKEGDGMLVIRFFTVD